MVEKYIFPSIELFLRFFIGSVFIYAAVPKILNPYNFALAIATYQIVPLKLINIMAIILPFLELFAGVMLIVGYKTKANSFIILMLLIIFMIAIYQAIHRDLMLSSCGCFASEEASEEVTTDTLFRDLIFFVATVGIFLLNRFSKFSLDYLISRAKSRGGNE